MGVWKAQNISFAKAVAMTQDSDKMRQYLTFILGKFVDKACEDVATQGVDLAMYLQAVSGLLAQEGRLCAYLWAIDAFFRMR